MAKYEIKITEKDGQERLIACEKISTISDTVAAKKIVLILEDAYHAGGTVSRSSQNDLRLTVLKGEYEPEGGSLYTALNRTTGKITNVNTRAYLAPNLSNQIANNYCCAPTPELAEELSLVVQGNWLPKAGDYYFCCGSSEENYSFKGREEIRRTEFNFSDSQMHEFHYFPSEAQRTAFISNLTQPEEKVELDFDILEERFFEISNGNVYYGTYENREAIADQLNKMLAFCRSQGMKP